MKLEKSFADTLMFIVAKSQLNQCIRNRGSYIRAHVLLNSLNELGKRDKMLGLPGILCLLSYYIKNTLKSHFSRKNVIIFIIMYATLLWTSLCNYVSRKSIN